MAMMDDDLETLFAKVRGLPVRRKALAIAALSEIAEEDVYTLSDDERAVLQPALDRARRGEFASDAEVEELLDKPWK